MARKCYNEMGGIMKKFILIIICLLLGGCQKDIVYEDKTTDFLEIKKLKQEVYSDVFLNDILEIKNEDIKLLSENYQTIKKRIFLKQKLKLLIQLRH